MNIRSDEEEREDAVVWLRDEAADGWERERGSPPSEEVRYALAWVLQNLAAETHVHASERYQSALDQRRRRESEERKRGTP